MEKKTFYFFTVVDYVVFGSMLLLSALTGVYFGCRGKYFKKNENETLKDYLTGNRNLKPVPVAMSLIASYISGVTMLGTPAEIYYFGAQYWLIVFSMCLSGFAVATIYLPVFTKLQVCSSYEYLELRFAKPVRILASVFFVIDEIMFLPILIYVPSLAFNQVTGINVHIIGTTVCLICVFYTVLGGLKAVVYTDTWQTTVMFISIVVIVILGVNQVGGIAKIIEIGSEGNRIQPLNFSTSLYERYTVFSVLIGGFTYWTSFNAVNQTMVQRYLSLPTDKQSKLSVALFSIGVMLFVSLCSFCGLLVYAYYANCDPEVSERIKASDQLLPLFVMETVGHLKGVPGLFVAGVFGAALSSLSVVLNSTAVVLLEDFLRGCCRFNLTERIATIFCKTLIIVLGVMSIAFLFVVEHLGGVLAMATSLSAIASGTMFGVFSLGMLIPWANTNGAIIGAIAGFLMSGTVAYGSQFYNAAGYVVPHKLNVSVEKCFDLYGLNITATNPTYPDESDVFPLFRLSYLWIPVIGFITVTIVGIIVSLVTGRTDPRTLDPELISPICQWMLPEDAQRLAGSAIRRVRHRDVTDTDLSLISRTNLIEIQRDSQRQEQSFY